MRRQNGVNRSMVLFTRVRIPCTVQIINKYFIKMETIQELKSKLQDLSLKEISNAYEKFNPDFFNGNYEIPNTKDGWLEQIIEDINENGYLFKDIF